MHPYASARVGQHCSRGGKSVDGVQRRAVGGDQAGTPPAATTSPPSTTRALSVPQPQGGAAPLLLTTPLAGQSCCPRTCTLPTSPPLSLP